MGCSSCAHQHTERTAPAISTKTVPVDREPLIVKKSDSTEGKVKLRYYGGGLALKTTGCRSCGSTGQYTLTTTETISFASDDTPGGWFSQVFSVGHEYYVTRNQADYLLKLTFRNKAGQLANKFKEVE